MGFIDKMMKSKNIKESTSDVLFNKVEGIVCIWVMALKSIRIIINNVKPIVLKTFIHKLWPLNQ